MPNHSVNDSTVVKFSAAPLCFELGLDGIISGRLWYRYVWNDTRLAYDPAKFGGIKVIRVNPSFLWTPDIILYNREAPLEAAQYPDKTLSSNCLVYPSGKVLWVLISFFTKFILVNILFLCISGSRGVFRRPLQESGR